MPVRSPKPKLDQVPVHPVDPQCERELVEVHVAGLDDGVVQPDPAVSLLLPVTVPVLAAGQRKPAGAPGFPPCVADPAFKPREPHERLDGRPGRILSIDRPIEERAVGGALQSTIGFGIDSTGEQVGIDSRAARHREHRTGHGVEGDDRPVLITEGRLGRALQSRVHGQVQVPAGNRIVTFQHPEDSSLGIGLDPLVSGLAVQPVFEGRLDTRLADVGRPSIIGLVDTIEIVLVDAADIADEMAAERSERVAPGQARNDVDSGESVPVDCEPGNLTIFQTQTERDLLEMALAGERDEERLFVLIANLDDLAQIRDQGVDVLDHLGHDLEAVGGQVLRQDLAAAIEDEPSRRRNRDDLHPIVFGQRSEVLKLDDLGDGRAVR